MSGRMYYQFRGTLEPELVTLYATVSVGAAGAVTFQKFDPVANSYSAAPSGGWRGITSVARTAAGLWTITLQDSYQRCLGLSASFLVASGLPAAPQVALCTGSLNNVRSGTAATVQVQFCSSAGVAADPASGEQITLRIDLSNSSLQS